MNRREIVQLLAGAVAIPALSGYDADALMTLGRRLNARAAAGRHGLFNLHQRASVGAIAERIIPATDTPGARAAGVPSFIELIVAEHYRDDERDRFLAGLADVDARSRTAFARDFIETTPAEQDGILATLVAEAKSALTETPPEKISEEPTHKPNEKPAEKPRESRPETPIEKPPFWAQIKFLTVYGYYTSELGVTRELRSIMIPGRYDPCAAAGIRAPGGT